MTLLGNTCRNIKCKKGTRFYLLLVLSSTHCLHSISHEDVCLRSSGYETELKCMDLEVTGISLTGNACTLPGTWPPEEIPCLNSLSFFFLYIFSGIIDLIHSLACEESPGWFENLRRNGKEFVISNQGNQE